MYHTIVTLKKGEGRTIKAGGAWIYDNEIAEAHRNADIHIHDLDFLTLTTTCCQIDIEKLFKDGFSTGHGFLREANDIQTVCR